MALRGCGTDEPLAVAIQRRFAELALRKRGYSAANNLVAGIRMLEKLTLIRATVTDLHRLQLRAIGKMAKAEDRPRVWATVADFQTFAERRVHWAWARVFFALGMAFTICLRISDVAQIRWGWLAHKGWLVFFDYKVAKEMCAQPIPPFWERWRHWLYTHRRPHQHDENIFIPGGPDALRKLQTELFTGTECGLSEWHPWKRMGAACFRALEDPCRPWHYGPAGGHQGKQHDTQRTHRHGRCHPGSSFHHQWVNQGTSRATVSGL